MYRRSGGPNPDFISVVDSPVRFDGAAIESNFQRRIDIGDSVNAVLASEFDHLAVDCCRSLRQPNLYVALFAGADPNNLAHDYFCRAIVERRDVNYPAVCILI